MNKDKYCIGIQCPVKCQCKRYTHGVRLQVNDGTTARFMRKCTNQKQFIQDEDNIIKNRKML